MGDVIRDVRFALRAIRRGPAIAGAVIATLTVGIGATLAVFSLVDGVLLHPVPVPEPERVVRVFQALSETAPHGGTAFPTLADYREAGAGLEGPAGFSALDVGVRAGDVTDRVSAGLVTGDFFDVLRVPAELGRTLQPADGRLAAPSVVVLGHGLWERLFGSDPGVVGRTVEISGSPFEVVGVAPAGFRGVTLEAAPELWMPLARVREASSEGLYAAPNILETRAFPWISMVGRMPPDVAPETVETHLDGVARALREELGDQSGLPDVERQIRLRPLAESAVVAGREGLVRFVGLLGTVVLLTLVVACANAAYLISARAATRSRELGVRQSLGAGRGRLVRHLLSESLVLASLGGAAGLGLATLSLRALGGFSLPGGIPLTRIDLGLDGRLVVVALLLTVATAAAFGLGPALAEGRHGPAARIRRSGSDSRPAGRAAPVLLALQVGISVVLTVGALLFTRTLGEALSTDLGFEPGGLAAATVAFRGHGYAEEEIPGIVDRLTDEVRGSPGITDAAFASHLPLSPSSLRLRPIPVGADDEGAPGTVHINVVSPGYVETLGVDLVEGRLFERSDTEDAPEVALLNRAAADLLWPGERALGRELVLVRGLEPITVVGIVEDHKVHGVADDGVPYLYLAAAQSPQLLAGRGHLVARADGEAGDALAVVRARLRAFDPALPVQDGRLVDEQIGRVLMPQRFGGLLLGLLAGVTLAVSAIGVYGMVTFGVRRRTREIGIRLALGASPREIVAAAVAGAGAAVGAGILVGLALAGGLARFVEEYLYGVAPLDPPSFVGAAAVLAGAALLAAVLPAWRAVTLDPRTAIGGE